MSTRLLLLYGLFLTAFAAIGRAESIWIEGEDANTKQVTRHSWYDGVKKDVLSGGEWLSHFNAQKQGLATYKFETTGTGAFKFWIRANHVQGSLSHRMDRGD